MANTAVVVYISPKIASNYTIWCLEPIAGKPLIKSLLQRLQASLPPAEFEYVVLVNDSLMSGKLKALFDGPGVNVFESQALSRLQVLGDYCKANPQIKTILIFPEESIFPDCKTAKYMLQMHRGNRADGTVAEEYPVGLVPEIYETQALIRLAGLGLPEDVSSDVVSIMDKAQQLAGDDKEMQFTVLKFGNHLWSDGPALDKLPVRLLMDSLLCQEIAEKVLQRDPSGHDAAAAYLYKEELLRFQSQPQFKFSSPRPGTGRIPILFTTLFGGYSGAEESFYQLISHLDRRRFAPFALLGQRGVLSEKLAQAGIPVEFSPMDLDAMTPLSLNFCERLLEEFQIRLIHVNVDAGAPILLAARRAGIPVVCHVRNLVGKAAPELMKLASKIIAISQLVAQHLRRSDLPPEKIQVVYNGTDLEKYKVELYNRADLRRQAGIAENTKVITMIARITPQKRQGWLLQAFPGVLKKVPNVLVILVGECYAQDAVYGARLRAIVAELGLAKHVRFWGFEKEIVRIHAMSDAAVLCTDNEPFGRAVQEAIAMGVPVVLPNSGGYLEIIRDGENGLIYNAADPRSLSETLNKLFTQPYLAKAISNNGLKTAQELSIASHVVKVTAIYESLLVP